jgi:glycine betaine monooxygenase B
MTQQTETIAALDVPAAPLDAPVGVEGIEAGVSVRVLPYGVEIFVRPDETILDAGLRSGLPLASSCRQGMCGTCRLRKLSGEVEMQQNGGLFDDEVEDGEILACCSYPLTPLVVACE